MKYPVAYNFAGIGYSPSEQETVLTCSMNNAAYLDDFRLDYAEKSPFAVFGFRSPGT